MNHSLPVFIISESTKHSHPLPLHSHLSFDTPPSSIYLSTMPSTTKKMQKARRYLADDYEPHVNDVLIGRGRRVETHNKKFRAMISAHLAAYYNAQTKATKGQIQALKTRRKGQIPRGGKRTRVRIKNGRSLAIRSTPTSFAI